MNKLITMLLLVVLAASAYLVFFRADPADNAPSHNPQLVGDRQANVQNTQQENMPTDNNMNDSRIQWSAKKVVGANSHVGTVDLASSKLETENGMLTGGEFVIDMTTIKNEDITNQAMNDKLVSHLKSDDFFSVEKFPEANFVSTSVEQLEGDNYQITGDLTIKGITNQITFPATITSENGKIKAQAKFSIDRTKWDVRYGSNTFFGNLGDQAIDDMINFDIRLES